jgi:hypothetical protein
MENEIVEQVAEPKVLEAKGNEAAFREMAQSQLIFLGGGIADVCLS